MKNRLDVIYKSVDDLVPYGKNPRNNDDAVEFVAKSIEEFGFKVPIILDESNEIIAGHTRLKAAKHLGMDEVPCIIAKDLTEEQAKAFRLADNKVSERSFWDMDLLKEELEDVDGLYTGFTEAEMKSILEIQDEQDEIYDLSVKTPVYEITGDKPSLEELVDTSRTDHLIQDIEMSDIDEDIKEMLKISAYRHAVFNYSKVAEYYAHSSKDVQKLMEDSAMIIIDFDRAIELGYVKLSKTIEDLIDGDCEEE